MKHRITATAIALLFGLSMPCAVAAQGHGGGHSGVGTPAAGTPAAGTPAVGTPAADSPAADTPAVDSPAADMLRQPRWWRPGERWPLAAPKAGATPMAPFPTSPTPGYSRPRDGRPVVGTAIPRSSGPRDMFVVTRRSTRHSFFARNFTASASVRYPPSRLRIWPAYYGLGYDHRCCARRCDWRPRPGGVALSSAQYEAAPPETEAAACGWRCNRRRADLRGRRVRRGPSRISSPRLAS